MTLEDAMTSLKVLGNDNMRMHNKKHGAGDNQFGVKKGDIRAVAKKIKTDDYLARELWNTGNIDARLLATLIVKPGNLPAAEVENMVRSEKFTQVADWLSTHVIKLHPEKEKLRTKWMKSKDIMCARAGWSLTAGKVAKEPDDIDITALLGRIEAEMPNSEPEVQGTMNTTLAYIGIHHPSHRQRALDIGEALGIYRNYPVSKGCTSPFAPIWINEMVRRQE